MQQSAAIAEKALETLKTRASRRKNVLLVLLFAVSTTMQVGMSRRSEFGMAS